MIRLKDAHKGERALVIFGGPSLLAQGFDFGWLRDCGYTTFLETKALTPGFLSNGVAPDYYLMLFPEKTKDNTLQHWVYRSLLADYDVEPLLKPVYRPVAAEIRARFAENFETWRPEKGPHKNFRWRPDVYLRDSPYELLAQVPQPKIIANQALREHYFPHYAYEDRTYYFDYIQHESEFDLDKYYTPIEREGRLFLRCADTFMNSAAIALYPLLRYMGFKETYFIGMDMSILGSLEYAAPYTFQSMAHFWWFLRRNGRVFNGNYRANGWLFKRPQSEFDNLRLLWNQGPVRFTRVYDPWRHSSPIDGIPTMSIAEFLKQ
jgi:hypothetical protein